MAVTQAFFDPTESYVAGSVFINTLGAFTNRRFAMNEQMVKQMDPVALNKAMAALQTQIYRQKKGLVTDYELSEIEGERAHRYVTRYDIDDTAAARRASSADKKAAAKRDKAVTKANKSFAKVTAPSEIEKIATQIYDDTAIEAFRDVTDAAGLQKALSKTYRKDSSKREIAWDSALANLYSDGAADPKVKQWEGIPGLEDIPLHRLAFALEQKHGLNFRGGRKVDGKLVDAAPSATDGLLLFGAESNAHLDLIKEAGLGRASIEYGRTSGRTAPYRSDLEKEFAAKGKAGRMMSEQRAAAEAQNKQVQAQIDQLEKQKLGLATQLEKALSGDVSDLYGGFQELGISNLALHSPFIQEGAVQRRMPPERSMDIDVDIAGMMPDVQLPKPQMPDVQLPKRKRKDDEDDFDFAPGKVEVVEPEEKRQKREKSMDPLFSRPKRKRPKRKNPIARFADDDPDYLDAVTPPEPDPENERVRAIENMKEMDPEWFSELNQEELANLFIVPLAALLDQEDNFKREFRDRKFTLDRGGKPILRSDIDADIMSLAAPTIEAAPDPNIADSDFGKFKELNDGRVQGLPEGHPLLAKGYSPNDTISYTTKMDGSKVYKINLYRSWGNDYRFLKEEDIKSWDDFPTKDEIEKPAGKETKESGVSTGVPETVDGMDWDARIDAMVIEGRATQDEANEYKKTIKRGGLLAERIAPMLVYPSLSVGEKINTGTHMEGSPYELGYGKVYGYKILAVSVAGVPIKVKWFDDAESEAKNAAYPPIDTSDKIWKQHLKDIKTATTTDHKPLTQEDLREQQIQWAETHRE